MNNLNLSNEQLELLSSESLRALLDFFAIPFLGAGIAHEDRMSILALQRQINMILEDR